MHHGHAITSLLDILGYLSISYEGKAARQEAESSSGILTKKDERLYVCIVVREYGEKKRERKKNTRRRKRRKIQNAALQSSMPI